MGSYCHQVYFWTEQTEEGTEQIERGENGQNRQNGQNPQNPTERAEHAEHGQNNGRTCNATDGGAQNGGTEMVPRSGQNRQKRQTDRTGRTGRTLTLTGGVASPSLCQSASTNPKGKTPEGYE